MKSAWSILLCIAILAATTGFVTGYFGAPRSERQPANPQWLAPSPDASLTMAPLADLESPAPTASGFANQLVYFPEAVTADAESLPPFIETTADSEPGILPEPSSTATPLPAVSSQLSALERLIDAEFSNLSNQQRDVWLDVLDGLPLEDAAGILRLWKQFGHDAPESGIAGLFGADLASPIAVPARPHTTGSATVPDAALAAIQRMRALVVHNLLNAETHGFRRYEPLLEDTIMEAQPTSADRPAARSPGVALVGWRIDQRPGVIVSTGNSLDVAIGGSGYFIIRREDETLYSRCGRLCLDDAGRLTLDQPEHRAILHPELVIPSNTDEILIEPDGTLLTVRDSEEPQPIGRLELAEFRDPARLEPVGGTLYRATEASGPAILRGPDARTGLLRQGALESSNVRRDEELARLQWLDQLLKELARGR